MRQLIILMRTFWVLSLVSLATSQVVDPFDDGNFNSNPVWTGETGYWEIITNSVAGPDTAGSKTLHLNFPPSQDPGTKYISTQRAGSWGPDQSWGFWVGTRIGFNNPRVVWLCANIRQSIRSKMGWRKAPTGIYFLFFQSEQLTQLLKMVLVK